MTFNTDIYTTTPIFYAYVLNLVINGWPSILSKNLALSFSLTLVLNLVINGWPSILSKNCSLRK